MLHHIHTLRQKPDHHKKQIAFWASSVITAVVFLLWIVSFQTNLKQEDGTAVNESTSPLGALNDTIASAYTSIIALKNNFFTTTKDITASVQVENTNNN